MSPFKYDTQPRSTKDFTSTHKLEPVADADPNQFASAQKPIVKHFDDVKQDKAPQTDRPSRKGTKGGIGFDEVNLSAIDLRGGGSMSSESGLYYPGNY